MDLAICLLHFFQDLQKSFHWIDFSAYIKPARRAEKGELLPVIPDGPIDTSLPGAWYSTQTMMTLLFSEKRAVFTWKDRWGDIAEIVFLKKSGDFALFDISLRNEERCFCQQIREVIEKAKCAGVYCTAKKRGELAVTV
jgi:hypothetical protein